MRPAQVWMGKTAEISDVTGNSNQSRPMQRYAAEAFRNRASVFNALPDSGKTDQLGAAVRRGESGQGVAFGCSSSGIWSGHLLARSN